MSRHCAARTELEFLKSQRRSHQRSKTTFQLTYRLSWLRRSDTFSNLLIGLWSERFSPQFKSSRPPLLNQISNLVHGCQRDQTHNQGGKWFLKFPSLGACGGQLRRRVKNIPEWILSGTGRRGKPGMTPCWVWSREKDYVASPASELFTEYFKKSDWRGVFNGLYSWKNERSNSSESFDNFTAGWKWKDQIL